MTGGSAQRCDRPPFVMILVPAVDDTGPMRGAVALANGLVAALPVKLVSLKRPARTMAPLDARVELISLADEPSWPARIRVLRRLLAAPDGGRPVSISLCFSADAANALMAGRARIVSSVRGNLPQNYYYNYGIGGLPLAATHLTLLRRFDTVVAMSEAMQAQLQRWGLRRVVRIGNFIDEAALPAGDRNAALGDPVIRFAYVGSLSRRKRVDLVLRAMAALRGDSRSVHLDIVGDGPLGPSLLQLTHSLGVAEVVRFHGQVPDPSEIVRRAGWLVLASESEGMSRAMLEALHLGVPCIARDTDGNDELIRPGENGYLFTDDDGLLDAMYRAVAERDRFAGCGNLLPDVARQAAAVSAFRELVGV